MKFYNSAIPQIKMWGCYFTHFGIGMRKKDFPDVLIEKWVEFIDIFENEYSWNIAARTLNRSKQKENVPVGAETAKNGWN